jgi:hypothetical protein
MKKFLLTAPFVALAVACSGGGAKLQPGNYEMTTKVTNLEVPGAPPAVAEQMKTAMANEQKQTQCLKQEDIDNMGNKLGQAGAGGTNCNFTKTAFGSGTIDIAGTCNAAGSNATMTITGTNTGDSFESTMTVDGSQAGQQMKVTATTSGRRIGDC